MEHITINDILKATGGKLLCGNAEAQITHISIDSRAMAGNDLFVPLIGEKSDAHDFIDQAFTNGALASFTSRTSNSWLERSLGKTLIQVANTGKALQQLGEYYRKRFTLPIIGVTGSVGKTSTREMIAAALHEDLKVFRTEGNFNSQIGVPITLSKLSSADEIAVLELGMSEPEELKIIAKIVKPDVAVITNIGMAHMEQLGSKENICREKMTITEGMRSGGILILNGDDDLLKQQTAPDGIERVFYGTGENSDFRAVHIRTEQGLPAFTAQYGEKSIEVKLNVFGYHNVLNAMAALATAEKCGVPMEHAAIALENYRGFKGRQQIHHKKGLTIIDDSYNASPDSMKAGLLVLEQVHVTGKKMAVLADMMELGENSQRCHYEVGEFLSELSIDEVIVIGTRAKEIAKGIQNKNPLIHVVECDDRETAKTYMAKQLKSGDGVLLKGSNSMGLGELVHWLIRDES